MRVAALAALLGGLATLVVAAATGMPENELRDLALALLPGMLATACLVGLVSALMRRASFRTRLAAVALSSLIAALINLAVLAELMFVSGHDAALVGTLLAYALGAGLGAAIALARTPARAVDRLLAGARRLAAGDLQARVGYLDAGPELESLSATLDEMAERLEGSLAREREADERRRDLITAVSHDLRTPLAGLRAMVEAIDDGVVSEPQIVGRYIREMRGAVDSLVLLVDDLFELVQLDAGAIQAETERARLEDVVRSALNACDPQATGKRVELRLRLDGAGEAECSPRLERVVHNLLQNAIRHTPLDGTVSIEAHDHGDLLEVAVADTGEGIAPESLERVFEPFWRGDEARAGTGSGLGLALTKRIVEALGGEIQVESEPAHGARFAVLLPVAS